jgi:hypothetical protein
VAYTQDWEPLADALKRVMATGTNEDQAKTDLCHAVADRKIDVRVRIAANDYGMRGCFLSGRNVGVPPRLEPDSLDWLESRPLEAWSIGPRPGEHYSWIGGWEKRPIDLIELSTADVVDILCGAGLGDQAGRTSTAIAGIESAAIRDLASHLRNNIGLKRAEAAQWCATRGFKLTHRGFQNRVWPKARAEAGLEAKAPPGRKALPGPKRKSSR